MDERTCRHCGAKFQTTPSAPQKYCSRTCSARAVRKAKQAPRNKGGRPRTAIHPVRVCKACGKEYQARNGSYCSTDCRLTHVKDAMPAWAELVRAGLVAGRPQRQIADEVAKATGKPCTVSQVARVVAKLRAASAAAALAAEIAEEKERVAALRAAFRDVRRSDRAAPSRAVQMRRAAPAFGLRKQRHVTQSGACVSLAFTILPEVSEAEVRLGRAAWEGFERGLQLPPEKPVRKQKTRSRAVGASG